MSKEMPFTWLEFAFLSCMYVASIVHLCSFKQKFKSLLILASELTITSSDEFIFSTSRRFMKNFDPGNCSEYYNYIIKNNFLSDLRLTHHKNIISDTIQYRLFTFHDSSFKIFTLRDEELY